MLIKCNSIIIKIFKIFLFIIFFLISNLTVPADYEFPKCPLKFYWPETVKIKTLPVIAPANDKYLPYLGFPWDITKEGNVIMASDIGFLKWENGWLKSISLINNVKGIDDICIKTNDEFVIIADGKLGYIKDLKFIPQLDLPGKKMKVKMNKDNSLYLWSNLKKDVYFLKNYSADGKVKADSMRILKLFHGDKRIVSVSGDGDKTFIVVGKNIVGLKWGEKPILFYHHKDEIKSIAYEKGNLVFYSTDNNVGFIYNNKAYDFISGGSGELKLYNSILYINFKDIGWLIKIEVEKFYNITKTLEK
ncbi:hypothetical protein KAU33_11420 [Candidatus Dependentiae bacterium]|nr:hypothetical protein [Candidatus Dependentiae bacterium]